MLPPLPGSLAYSAQWQVVVCRQAAPFTSTSPLRHRPLCCRGQSAKMRGAKVFYGRTAGAKAYRSGGIRQVMSAHLSCGNRTQRVVSESLPAGFETVDSAVICFDRWRCFHGRRRAAAAEHPVHHDRPAAVGLRRRPMETDSSRRRIWIGWRRAARISRTPLSRRPCVCRRGSVFLRGAMRIRTATA